MGGKDRMKEAKNVIVGFGKAGKTLAFKLAAKGESVILLEKSDQMYGALALMSAASRQSFCILCRVVQRIVRTISVLS